MEIFPAIDIRGGQVVRLRQGDYGDMQVYGNDPLHAAERFMKEGAVNLHVVDLDGAKEGEAVNFDLIHAIVKLPGLFVEVGGGIRDQERIERYLELGVGRVILGTVAVRNFPFVETMVRLYGDKIAVGVDARNGYVAVSGWLENTGSDSFGFCERLRDAGVSTVIYTDISKDGELNGTNLEACRRLRELGGLNVIASGGISFEHELIALRDMGTYGAILGKALYVKKLELSRAIRIAKGEAL
ncbi:MAG TPA: 1-(5-phosphoribosyl)-5-[(5-phosphoribosylamino)methylideneamino]imidazole-4-carboxamide isomerase [Feifaniaceae bacterium]|nr:1-(5-phosphoribosyl)-5-[(5-phosphoribosylamino)methylideneamino]imidazole-4-carboxamide isomerase [Feifaniaceae bacterium]